jgi:DNA-binding NarL/FixJ family response regulator
MRVFIADDSRAIVHSIQKMKPDALILDLQMPGGSGLDVLRAIRTEHPQLYVLICTNYPYPQFREKCLNAGANVFLDKSTEFEKIPDILRGLIENETKVSPDFR